MTRMKILFLVLSLSLLSCYTKSIPSQPEVQELIPSEKIISVKVEGQGVEGFYGSCVIVSMTGQDNLLIEYSIDGGKTWSIYNEGFEVCNTTSILYKPGVSSGNYRPGLYVINIDRKPPEIIASIEPLPNKDGWNNTDVIVSFYCRDYESGIRECPQPVRVSNEGKNQIIKARAIDKVGNIQQIEVVINIDKTPPFISVKGVENKRVYSICDRPSPEFLAEDSLSGLKTAQSFHTEDRRVGELFYTVRASDMADNITELKLSYRINYKFEGFRPPVSMEKPFRKGSVIPVIFRLSDGCGNPVSDVEAKIKIELVSRTVPEGEAAEFEEQPLFGDRGDEFWYDYVNSQYVYNLSTDNLFEGLWRITVSLDDGQSYSTIVGIK